MAPRRTYQVKEVAELAGVSVRALHHYDEIGLLVPEGRSAAGYRLYDEDDLLRLQQIVIGRELGLPLEEIRRSLDDPRFSLRDALVVQRAELEKRSRQTVNMIRAVDAALRAIDERERGLVMSVKEIFDGFDPEEHEAEAKARWGDTDAYAESMRRTKTYGAEEWKALAAEQAAIYAAAVAAKTAGKSSDDPVAMDVAERHRLSIDRWFYPCSRAMHRGLADLYESDPRFAANIDKHGEGLTAYLAEAIRRNAAR